MAAALKERARQNANSFERSVNKLKALNNDDDCKSLLFDVLLLKADLLVEDGEFVDAGHYLVRACETAVQLEKLYKVQLGFLRKVIDALAEKDTERASDQCDYRQAYNRMLGHGIMPVDEEDRITMFPAYCIN